ncbi:ASPIC and UnbV [Neorhodopirellula pilleata]|uniref:ASPIC and UnbV n=2 Tax=Neorhodopirellula pilleata TaxID=2714738 RepID=A0A5C6A2X8_9BACT|nr:ASPIC and UnbV [Neorhodopirellula pilleata]
MRHWLVLVIGLITVGCGPDHPNHGRSISDQTSSNPSSLLGDDDEWEMARAAYSRKDWRQATNSIRQAMIQRPESSEVFELAGDIFRQTGEPDVATESYQTAISLTHRTSKPSRELLDKLARTWMSRNRPFEALEGLRDMVRDYPQSQPARSDLAGLLAHLGQEREAAEHLRWLVQRGHGGIGELMILADLSRPQVDEAMCQAVLQQHPAEHRVQLPLAKLDAHFNRWASVESRLRPVIALSQAGTTATALYGRALVELADQVRLQAWQERLPAGIEQESQYWLALGGQFERLGNAEAAAQVYWNAIVLDEFDTEALGRLAGCLAEQHHQSDAHAQIASRIEHMTQLRRAIDGLAASSFRSQQRFVQIARLLDSMGRSWEAAAWLRAGAAIAAEVDPQLEQCYLSIRSSLTGTTPWQRPEFLLTRHVNKIHLGNPKWPTQTRPTKNPLIEINQSARAADQVVGSTIRFQDEAFDRGLKHRCAINKPPGEESGLWIYQSISGGAGVLDGDLDGWPDLYLTTMNGDPLQDNSGPNQYFRNLDGSFRNVTTSTGVGDAGFAQGVAVADCNADGFPDLLVANIGQNRLYRNNGDGTFVDITEQTGLIGPQWTTSVAMLDINDDGQTDIFDVGYCAGDEAFDQPCIRDGRTRSCSPLTFTAQRDRVWQGRPDGSFENVSEHWLGEHDPSCGLAIAAGQFDEAHGIDIYVANDMSANHFWSSAVDSDGLFRLREQASVRGLAVGARSLAQASMGIAVADPDADGDIDFFLTNHAGEPNAFYEQVAQGQWVDRANMVGLAVPSVPMLGFGTQWLDADNSGSLELMIANGHVDDFDHVGDAYRMPPQMFQRSEEGVLTLLDAESLGPYFESDRLGRSLVNIDFNRDGLTDLVVTHLFDPVALLANRTPTPHRAITLHLKNKGGRADAFGSIVSVEVEGRVYRSQLIGGAGFHCSPQQTLHFGLGRSTGPNRVSVQWGGGQSESFGELQAGGEYLLVQGEGAAFLYSSHR